MFGTLNPGGNNNSVTPGGKISISLQLLALAVSQLPWSGCKRDWGTGVKLHWNKELRGGGKNS